MSTLTTTTSASARITAAGQHALAMDHATSGFVLAEVFGILAGVTHGSDDQPITRAHLADLMDRAVADAIGMTLREGDRVSLEVNDLGGAVVGTVAKVHNAIGQAAVVEVLLPGGRIFQQSARFVKPVTR